MKLFNNSVYIVLGVSDEENKIVLPIIFMLFDIYRMWEVQ